LIEDEVVTSQGRGVGSLPLASGMPSLPVPGTEYCGCLFGFGRRGWCSRCWNADVGKKSQRIGLDGLVNFPLEVMGCHPPGPPDIGSLGYR
jgi:hypothetical protein